MPTTSQQIYLDALKLPTESRAQLAERLVFSLGEDISPAIEQAHLIEVRRRIAQVEAGEVKLISSSRVHAAARAELKRLAKK